MQIDRLKKSLRESYSKELCYPKVQDKWNIENKSFGMCAITALIVNDYFGGDIGKIYVEDVSHYFNVINDEIIDLTSEQFIFQVNYDNYIVVNRDDLLNGDTLLRYNNLKNRVVENLLKHIDEKVAVCNACGNLVEKFTNLSTVYLGKSNNIVLIGEAPANNGWRKSHMLWKDINGKILPSGVVLQKLFDILNMNIFEITFLESVKCYPLNRKNLKVCSYNCKNIMLEQLDILRPDLVITLGEFPSKKLLNFKFEKFSSIVGNIYDVDGYKVLPIYHPSPISPKSYSGNLPVFEKLKDYLKKEDY
ncbi:MAG: hypothetical protein IJ475_01190 [Bacilli bacterium]|nr:hypothetical protein [Bacilli bacterium]